MKITVFTSNQPRHLSLLEDLAGIADEVFAVVHGNTIFPGQKLGYYDNSQVMQEYFTSVIEAEQKVFGPPQPKAWLTAGGVALVVAPFAHQIARLVGAGRAQLRRVART